MSELRAVLFTDVVGSTELAARVGDERIAALWTAHDRAARDLLRIWGGREIDKADGMLTVFDRAADAVGFALAYHAALAALDPPLHARAGVHLGPTRLRENALADVARGAKPVEVDGLAKSIAARVMSIAGGGQTLLTAEARAELDAAALDLRSHGHWRAKGLAEPFEVFEAKAAGAAPLPPPTGNDKAYRVVRENGAWRPADRMPHNLPAERDAFVGRQSALDELALRLRRGDRLLSIVGVGGCGKTRLAVHFAWQWLGDFPGGAWFCDLAPARGVDGILHAVASALDVPLGRDDPVVQLGHAIAGRGRCLVVLDNFEQVSRHAEATLGRWLGRANEACFVVTTREVLGIAGEAACALAPLGTDDASALFVSRAEAAAQGAVAQADERQAIGPLVELLDGLPLAIELAAARVRVMPPRQLLARMNDRFRLLVSTGRRRDRQATLRATFDWSWELLCETEKSALAQLSVFEGGFTLAAAEAALDLGEDAGNRWSVDVLQSLVDKSFVRSMAGGRFGMLDTVQEYAAEQLRSPGRFAGSGPGAVSAAQSRHGVHFAGLSESMAIADRCADLDNLIVACRRAVMRDDLATATGALENAWAGLRLRGPFRVGVELAQRVCAMAGLAGSQRAHALRIAGIALDAAGDPGAAQGPLEAALSAAREVSDVRCEADVLGKLATLTRNRGRVEQACEQVVAALVLAEGCGDRALQCDLHNELGSLRLEMGQVESARTEYETVLRMAREIGDRRWEGGALGNLGNLHAEIGRMDEARHAYEAGIAVAREVGDRQWEGNMLCNLGFLHLTQRSHDEARANFEAALHAARQMGHARLECIALCNLGIALGELDEPDPARQAYEAALDVARRIGERRCEGQFLTYLGLLDARQGRQAQAQLAFDGGEALLRQVADRISLGVLLCARAEACALAGRTAQARSALDDARSIADESQVGPESELGLALSRVEALLAGAAGG